MHLDTSFYHNILANKLGGLKNDDASDNTGHNDRLLCLVPQLIALDINKNK